MRTANHLLSGLRQIFRNQQMRLDSQLLGTMEKVPYNLLWIVFFFTLCKLFLLLPYNGNDHFFLIFKLISLFNCVLVGCFVFFYPRYVHVYTRVAVILMTFFMIGRAVLLPEHLNFLSIQHMYIVIMTAFFCVNHRWGIGTSLVLAVFVSSYIYIHSADLNEFTLLPTSLPMSMGLLVITLNFVLIGAMHYYYNRTLVRMVSDVGNLNQQLSASLKVKNNFLSVMSHELRTPLNSVVGTAHLLAEEEVSETQRRNLENLRFSAESLTILINDILDFSKMDTQSTRLENTPFSIAEITERVFSILRQRAEEKRLEYTLDIDSNLKGTRVLGDPSRLTQILYNIIGNAIKFTQEGKVVMRLQKVTSASDQPSNQQTFRQGESRTKHCTFVFTISDTGVGIDPTDHERIFEPFVQVASSSIHREFGGVGLGLAIVKHLVNLHGGKIRLSSQIGSGSMFQLELPYDALVDSQTTAKLEPQGALSESASPNRPERSLSEIKLLMAEDNQMNILFMRQMLKKWGITADVAGDGNEVIQLFDAGKEYDVVLMDIHMPKVSGLEATSYIRALELKNSQRRKAHIIALTASVSDRFTDSLVELGFDDYVRKPFRPEDLQSKIQKILEQSPS